MIDAYGVRNGFRGAGSLLPHPAVLVIDPAGEIRFCSVDRNYKKRTTMRTIFAALDGLAAREDGLATETQRAQRRASTSAPHGGHRQSRRI